MEDEAFKDVRDPSKEEKESQQELEKRIFHLKTLYDLSQEIGFLRGTQEIIKNLLLMMIGNFGAFCGFIFLFDMSQRKTDVFSQRGLDKDSLDRLSQQIESGHWIELNGITEIQTITERNKPQAEENLFDLLSSLNLRIWIPFNIDANLRGGIGLGDKLSGDPYTPDDRELLLTMANQGAVAIESARLDQARIEALEQSKKELEKLNRAKSKALDHLSHELRTPLSVIQGNIRILKRKTQAQTPPLVREEVFESLEKNLARLSDIQQETDQIIRSHQELEMKPRLEEFDQAHSFSPKTIPLYSFTERVLKGVKEKASHRDIQFQIEGEKDLHLVIDPKILEQSLVGLLKNAVENTPEEGIIRVILEQKNQWIQLKVMDFGSGITKENQRHLFNGLFHTLDTELYTSKKPYDFGAGGKGLDLLRLKAYGQRFGFDVSVGSQRCIYIPTDHDLCPGKISECPHGRVREDCLNSGGSTFCLTFVVTGG
ncbi:MAG: ATP-binding protein [Desulfobacterales bacterium]|nr:ATP-binding protein [Desulfobacterales bacterium]